MVLELRCKQNKPGPDLPQVPLQTARKMPPCYLQSDCTDEQVYFGLKYTWKPFISMLLQSSATIPSYVELITLTSIVSSSSSCLKKNCFKVTKNIFFFRIFQSLHPLRPQFLFIEIQECGSNLGLLLCKSHCVNKCSRHVVEFTNGNAGASFRRL